MCHMVVMCIFLPWKPESVIKEPFYVEIEREYTHCYPVMKFKDDFVIMYWETKCVKRKYTSLEEG